MIVMKKGSAVKRMRKKEKMKKVNKLDVGKKMVEVMDIGKRKLLKKMECVQKME
jgi:hypothetical protein